MYTRDSIVTVRPFTRQREGEEIVIGSLETGIFLALPPEAVDLLDQLAAGKTVGEVSDRFQQETGQTPDMSEFLMILEKRNLVAPYGGEDNAGEEVGGPSNKPKYHFSSFPQPLAKLLFSGPVLICEGLLGALALLALLKNPSLLPVPADLVFPDRRAISLTILTVITYACIFMHEMAHLVAARAVGVNSRMGISHRLWYLVAETDMTDLWSVARSKRYMPMLAGMLVDAVSIAVFVLILFAEDRHFLALPVFAVRLIRAIAFTGMMRILWECFFFTRTDLYYVAATFLNCKNLLNDTRIFLGNQVSRISSRAKTVDQSAIPRTERRAIRTYAWLFLAGRIWAFATLFWVTIPVVISYGSAVAGTIRSGYTANPSNFLDTMVAATFFLVPTVTGFVFWGRTFTGSKEFANGNS